jgi:hypothetical protein
MPVAPGLSQKARRRGVLVILLMNLAAVPFREWFGLLRRFDDRR